MAERARRRRRRPGSRSRCAPTGRWPEWQRLAAASPIPLAAGENAIGEAAFAELIASRAVAVVQPDLAKWGGISGVAPVVDRIAAAGLR